MEAKHRESASEDLNDVAVRPTRVLSLCSGVGGLDLGVALAMPGARVVGFVEREAFAAAVLVARMADSSLDQAPIWDDVATFDGKPWRGAVDLIVAGFPCQPWSHAGKRLGTEDDRWLWPIIARIIGEAGPSLVFLENVPGLVSGGGLGEVLGSLADLGYDASWTSLRASDVGAPHRRERVFILGWLPDVADARRRALGRSAERELEEGRQDHRGGGAEMADHAPLCLGIINDGRCRDPVAHAAGIRDGESGSARGPETGHDSDGDGEAVADYTGRGEGAAQLPGQLDLIEPNSKAVADPASDLRGTQRDEGPEASDGAGAGAMAVAVCGGGRPTARNLGGPGGRSPEDRTSNHQSFSDGEAVQHSANHRAASGALGNPDDPRPQGRGRVGGRADELPPWPPGPEERDLWNRILSVRPDLAPAVPNVARRRGGTGSSEPPICGVSSRISDWVDRASDNRVDRLRALGNAVVPAQAAAALRILLARIGGE